jgi:hypothetical protein
MRHAIDYNIPFLGNLDPTVRAWWPQISDFFNIYTASNWPNWTKTIVGSALCEQMVSGGYTCARLFCDLLNDQSQLRYTYSLPMIPILSSNHLGIVPFRKVVWEAILYLDFAYGDVDVLTFFGFRSNLVTAKKIVVTIHNQKLSLYVNDGAAHESYTDYDFLSYYYRKFTFFRIVVNMANGNINNGSVELWINNELKITTNLGAPLTSSLNEAMSPIFQLYNQTANDTQMLVGCFRQYYMTEDSIIKPESM